MKHWKFRSRNSNRTTLKDFSKDFNIDSSRNPQISIEKHKIEKFKTDNLDIHKSFIRSQEIEINKEIEDLSLVSWGSGKEGALGNGKCSDSNEPVKVFHSFSSIILQIACGAGNTIVLTSDNSLYSWGFNSVGQLGLGDFKNRNVPCKINHDFCLIKKIVSGAGHCMVVNDDGVLFSWGCAGFYQTGHGKLNHSSRPEIVEYFRDNIVNDASCGISHSLVITKSQVYAFGDNKHSQCSGRDLYYSEPKQINLSGVKKVAAGGAHSLFLTSNRRVFACGLNSCGQLGIGNKDISIDLVELKLEEIKNVYAGEEISACLTKDGKVYVWGWNGFGQLGQGHFGNLCFPTIVDNMEKINQISLGVSAIGLVSKSKKAYLSGYIGLCRKNELEKNNLVLEKNLAEFKHLITDANVTSVGIGRTHCVFFVESVIKNLHSDYSEILDSEYFEKINKNSPISSPLLELEPKIPEFQKNFNSEKEKEKEKRKNLIEKEDENSTRKKMKNFPEREPEVLIEKGIINLTESSSVFSKKLPQIFKKNNSIVICKTQKVARESSLKDLLSPEEFKEEKTNFFEEKSKQDKVSLSSKPHSDDKLLLIEVKEKNSRTKSIDKEIFKESYPQTSNSNTKTASNLFPVLNHPSVSDQQRIRDLETLIKKYDKKISQYYEPDSPKIVKYKKKKRIGGGFLR